MLRLWNPEINLWVAGDWLYLPLMFDPAIAQELQTRPPSHFSPADCSGATGPLVVEVQGKPFVRTIRLTSLLENYASVDPASWKQQHRAVLNGVEDGAHHLLDPKLAVILFQIMPYFLRRRDSLTRQGLEREDVLRLLEEQVQLPASYTRREGHLPGNRRLRGAVAHLAQLAAADPGPPPAGLITAEVLRKWFLRALATRIAIQERERLAAVLAEQEKWGELYRRHAGLLTYLAEYGTLEVDGFGFVRLRSQKNEYLIYKRTGVYALKDFYGRPYIFPDCRVAVSTFGQLRPFVIDRYKHPFLYRHAPGQYICLPKDFPAPLRFSAAGVIQALEAGIHTLYYGYNPRRRNGYHSLDRVRQMQTIDFDDYRVAPDDPKIISGEVEVKNIFF